MAGVVDTLGNVLTRGIDAAASVLNTKFQVSNPNPSSSTPGGIPVTAGQPAGALNLGGVPLVPLLVAGIGVLVLVKLLRK